MVRIEPHQTVEKKDMPAASPRKNVDVDEVSLISLTLNVALTTSERSESTSSS
jgi:hypothetical protein